MPPRLFLFVQLQREFGFIEFTPNDVQRGCYYFVLIHRASSTDRALIVQLCGADPTHRALSGTMPPAITAPDSLEGTFRQTQSSTGLVLAGNTKFARRIPSTGMRLIREWHGRTHIVDVVEGGYVWHGQNYGSLSVIARRDGIGENAFCTCWNSN